MRKVFQVDLRRLFKIMISHFCVRICHLDDYHKSRWIRAQKNFEKKLHENAFKEFIIGDLCDYYRLVVVGVVPLYSFKSSLTYITFFFIFPFFCHFLLPSLRGFKYCKYHNNLISFWNAIHIGNVSFCFNKCIYRFRSIRALWGMHLWYCNFKSGKHSLFVFVSVWMREWVGWKL
jgi:hypothetical protein